MTMPFELMANPVYGGIAGAMPATFAAFARAAAPIAVSALWQGAIVAIALVLSLRFVPRVSASHRFAAWTAGFFVVAGLPFLPLFEHVSATGTSAPLKVAAAKPWLSLDSRWAFLIAALWLIASAFRLGQLVLNSLRLRRLWKTAVPVEVAASVRALLATATAARDVEICTTRELDRPSVIGFLAPRILIPDWLFSRLTPGELEQVVLHEAEHLRRRDDWTNLLQKLSLVVFPLNPALAWMERRLCREREMACDEGVVRRTQAPRSYAACLASLAERGLQYRVHALSLGAFGRRPELVHRVHSILKRKPALHPLAGRGLIGAVACGLLIGSVELARCPQVVAFVAPSQHVQAASLSRTGAAAADRAPISPNSALAMTDVRAIEAKAIVAPSSNNATLGALDRSRRSAEPQADAAKTLTATRELSDGAPRAEFVKAVVHDPATAQPQGQEYVVFAAWEQVETAAPQSRTVADYDNGEPAQAQAGAAAGERSSSRTAQVTVTRVILLVYSPGAAPVNSASGGATSHATSSHSKLPAAPATQNGRLAFQL